MRTSEFLAGAAVALIVSTAGITTAPASTSDTWTEVTTAHFRVVGPDGTHPVTLARRMETFREVLAGRGHVPQLDEGAKVSVVVLPGDQALLAFGRELARSDTKFSAATIADPAGPFIVINGRDPEDDVTSAAYRSYVDLALALDVEPVPLWYREGLAAYYQTFGTAGRSGFLGRAVPEYVTFLRQHEFLPLGEVLGMKRIDLDRLTPQERVMFTLESWALVHQQFAAGIVGKRRLVRMMDLQERGTEIGEAAAQAFGGLATAERALIEYVRAPRFAYRNIAFDGPRLVPMTVREVPRGDVLVEVDGLRETPAEIAGMVRRPGRPPVQEFIVSAGKY